MNIVKFLGAAMTFSMLGGALASAHTVPAPQPALSSETAGTSSIPAATSTMPAQGRVTDAPQAQQPTKTLALANFGQWDEAGSEN
jgi:hypothetical protein